MVAAAPEKLKSTGNLALQSFVHCETRSRAFDAVFNFD